MLFRQIKSCNLIFFFVVINFVLNFFFMSIFHHSRVDEYDSLLPSFSSTSFMKKLEIKDENLVQEANKMYEDWSNLPSYQNELRTIQQKIISIIDHYNEAITDAEETEQRDFCTIILSAHRKRAYLLVSLTSLLGGLSEEEKNDAFILVFNVEKNVSNNP